MTAPETASPPGDDVLSTAERQLLDAVTAGIVLDLRAGEAELDDPCRGAGWADDRTIRAELLAQLITGDLPAQGGQPRAIKLCGARITGPFDLQARTFTSSLLLQDCHIEQAIDFSGVTAPAICLPGCHLPALIAKQLRTTGEVDLCDGFTTHGEVNLERAHVGGQLNLHAAALANENGPALTADRLDVGEDMICRGLTARGEVRLSRAYISGDFDLAGASLENKDGPVLTAERLEVSQDMFCRGFTARGEVRLTAAHIGGQLVLNAANLHTDEGGTAFDGEELIVNQNMYCDDLTAHGTVSLIAAHIGRQLGFVGATLHNKNGIALNGNMLTVSHEMVCNEGFTAYGAVDLNGAHIGSQLNFNGATLHNENGTALNGDSLTVDESMFCGNSFTAYGEVDLSDAHIGRQLDLRGARLRNENGTALNAYALVVGQEMYWPQGFEARGIVNLVNAKVGRLFDNPAGWPATVRLRGLVYDDLGNDRTSVQQRLDWISRNTDGYFPQVYDQLATAYRNAGREGEARSVAIAKQRRGRHTLNPLNWLWYATVGYGYRTWLAGIWLAVFLAAGTWVFGNVHMVATTTHPPAFNSFAYTVDITIPIVDLGQKNAWEPQGAAAYCSWALTAAGWVLTAAVVAGLTGILKRD